MKTQTVRFIDVFALGPLMIWSAAQVRPRWARDALAVSGFLTILFNGVNLIRVQRGDDVLP